MPADDPNAHIASIEVAAPADVAFAFMADGMDQTHWALGSWDRRDEGDGRDQRRLALRRQAPVRPARVRPATAPRRLLRRVPSAGRAARSSSRRGSSTARDSAAIRATASSRSSSGATRARRPESWARTYHAFRTEVHLIKARVEGLLPWPLDVPAGGVGGVVGRLSAACAALDALFEPLELGSLTLRNRVMAGPATLLYARDNVLSDRHIAYYRERAAGGAAVIVSEEHAAHPTALGAFRHACTAWEPRAVGPFTRLADGGARARRPAAHPALRARASPTRRRCTSTTGSPVGAVADRRPRAGSTASPWRRPTSTAWWPAS